MDPNKELNINLFNFEDSRYSDSKYILTSPRSLEACSRLNIKPIEILTRSLEDFRDDLLPRGLSVRSIFEIYSEHERERQNKLQLCIEERQHIVTESAGNQNDPESDEDFQGKYDGRAKTGWKETPDKSQAVVTKGHDLNQAQNSKDDRKKSGFKKSLVGKYNYSCRQNKRADDFDVRLDRLTCSVKKKLNGLRKSSAGASKTGKKNHIHFKRSQSDLGYSSGLDIETGSVTSSLLSSRSCLTDVTAVTDPLLKKKLQGSINSSTRLRTKDQKILSVLLKKREQNLEEKKRSEQLHNQWDKEKEQEQQERDVKEYERRINLAKERNKMNEIKMEIEAKRSEMEEEKRRKQKLELENNSRASSETFRRQQMMKVCCDSIIFKH